MTSFAVRGRTDNARSSATLETHAGEAHQDDPSLAHPPRPPRPRQNAPGGRFQSRSASSLVKKMKRGACALSCLGHCIGDNCYVEGRCKGELQEPQCPSANDGYLLHRRHFLLGLGPVGDRLRNPTSFFLRIAEGRIGGMLNDLAERIRCCLGKHP